MCENSLFIIRTLLQFFSKKKYIYKFLQILSYVSLYHPKITNF